MRAALLALAALCGCAVAQAQAPAQPEVPLALKAPADVATVEFHGTAIVDAAGPGAAPMLYPAPGLAGFAAALITHGLINEGIRSKEQKARLEANDRVLEPYRPMLAEYKPAELLRAAAERLPWHGPKQAIEPNQVPAAGWMVEVRPVFFLTQDQRALVLENLISAREVSSATASLTMTVRVVSQPRTEENLPAAWSADSGAAMKAEAANLVAYSLLLAFGEARKQADANAAYRTVRYPEGGVEKIERAQVVAQVCNRMLIRTLRGWLLSVPAAAKPDEPACVSTLPGWG